MSLRIFVEGNDDKNFIVSILNDLKSKQMIIVAENTNFNNYIEVMGSKKNLLDSAHDKYKKISSKINFEIKRSLFIFDCDFVKDDNDCNGMEKSKECFDTLIENLKWKIDIDVHIFNRNLDYFLIETIKDKECYEHFDNLVTCLEVESVKPNKKPIANLYRDLYPYPKFDFNHPHFDEFKTKLQNLFEETP
ncbi:MAG: hypothetical protein KU38_07725 [Sulfurovum sp. FS08-3]|nr:MAG: hypothetical protein KU38_07725 [Sulfurovum sp. FS08-3]